MGVLADTRVLLWWLADDPALSTPVREAITDPRNQVLVSSISLAEISLQASIGKLEAPMGIGETLAAEGFDHLPFTAEHAEALRDLPWHHRDPFDRMLVAQARSEGLVMATADARLRAYGIPLV
jgi:PIN domain nuclease of toxin-antitoxin system